jgi:hypothetical protein
MMIHILVRLMSCSILLGKISSTAECIMRRYTHLSRRVSESRLQQVRKHGSRAKHGDINVILKSFHSKCLKPTLKENKTVTHTHTNKHTRVRVRTHTHTHSHTHAHICYVCLLKMYRFHNLFLNVAILKRRAMV